ncbi:MAG: hypothetical protein MUC76_04115 [Spirochaetes bacterium]|jgi:hypothetical protein|nr:hypothetical protein [Spirochaetota bacterium]
MKKAVLVVAAAVLLAAAYLLAGSMVDARRADTLWERVKAASDEVRTHPYDPNKAPATVRRYYRAVAGAKAGRFRGVELVMDGGFKLGKSWAGLEARQIIVPGKGFVWRARVGSGMSFVKGFDSYFNNEGSVNFRLWGLVPVAMLGGPDITRAAKGRLLAETTLVPSAFFGLYGKTLATMNPRRIRGEVEVDGEKTTLEIGLGDDGVPTEVIIMRWGDANPEKKFTYIPFGIRFTRMATFDGYTVPVEMAGGWNYGTPEYEETVRLRFTGVRFF